MGKTVAAGEFVSPPVAGRERTAPWYIKADLVGDGLYDTPSGKCMTVDEELFQDLYDYDRFDYCGTPFTGELIEPALAYARTLPDDTYLPEDQVFSALRGAVIWRKTISVSWMQLDESRHSIDYQVPMQHHRENAVITSVSRPNGVFGIMTPQETEGPLILRADCITDLHVELSLPDPESTAQSKARRAAEIHDRIAALLAQYARVMPTEQLPAGLQTDG